ncbi:acyltransferase [Pseudomonas denitrificans (nom. rej.)]|uniref:Acyltransferase n=1 Tax=Pseudomonas denitrificans TaxID=43306 RepID=A0A9X7N6L4_PSEDE|nr:acyltransferase [Pseudomonas denitrificans (nom. rej.)]
MHRNAFDLIRHLAALSVLVSHHYALSGLDSPGLGGSHNLGALAVLAFFSISGYLITLSFCRSASFSNYLLKRVARLFPALIGCSLLMVYVAAPLLSERGMSRLLDGSALLDFLRISAMGQANLPDVTVGFIFPDSFNGSLWTLKIEFACYLAVAALLSLTRGPLLPLGAALLLAGLSGYLGRFGEGVWAAKLTTYLSVASAFFLGSFFAFRQAWLARPEVLVSMIVVGIALLGGTLGSAWSLPVGSLAMCLITLGVGLLFTDRLIAGRFDVSYGIYLYAFPVQQVVINRSGLGFYPGMALTALLVLVLAALSWHLLECPALRMAHRRAARSVVAPVGGQME